MTTPRIHLAHRLLAGTLELAGLTGSLLVPDPEADHALRDLGAAGLALLNGRQERVATVHLTPAGRPTDAVVTVHLALSPAGSPLVADAQIGPALLDRLGFEAMP